MVQSTRKSPVAKRQLVKAGITDHPPDAMLHGGDVCCVGLALLGKQGSAEAYCKVGFRRGQTQ